MNTAYVLYSVATAWWIYGDAVQRNESRWWSLWAFVLPIFAPVYFSRTRPFKDACRCFGLWLSGYILFFFAAYIMK